MSRIVSRILLWSPRVLSALFAGFLSMFSLDAFNVPNQPRGLWVILLGIGMHLIPVAAVLIFLALAWRRPWVGAALYALAAFAYGAMTLPAHPIWFLTIGLPLLTVAGLFLVSWLMWPAIRNVS